MHLIKGSWLKRRYFASIIVNLIIILIGLTLQPNLLACMFKYEVALPIQIITLGLGICFGIYFIKFEAWLCKTSNVFKESVFKTPTIILIAVILVGLLEEIIFRGLVTEIAFIIGGKLAILFIFFGIISFGLSHLFLGWIQFVSKTIFSIVLASFYILTGNMLIPMLSHGVFNYFVAKRYPLESYQQ